MVDGNPGIVRGINHIGLQRRGFSETDIRALRNAYKKLFLKKDQNLTKAIESLDPALRDNPKVSQLLTFIETSERGIIR
jgi:UDP-N-acetylglucosamine acyltransferase